MQGRSKLKQPHGYGSHSILLKAFCVSRDMATKRWSLGPFPTNTFYSTFTCRKLCHLSAAKWCWTKPTMDESGLSPYFGSTTITQCLLSDFNAQARDVNKLKSSLATKTGSRGGGASQTFPQFFINMSGLWPQRARVRVKENWPAVHPIECLPLFCRLLEKIPTRVNSDDFIVRMAFH